MFSIIKNEARSFCRDITSIVFSIVFPCLLVFILGTFLESVENSDDTVGDINIMYCVSEDSIGVEKYIEALNEKGIIVAEKVENTDDFSERIKNSEICAAISEKDGNSQFMQEISRLKTVLFLRFLTAL